MEGICMDHRVLLYDCTLREGAQSAQISFSLQDKLQIVELLDGLGVQYIEAGNPGSNQKDREFYERLRQKPLTHAKLTAFGSTCRVGSRPQDDQNLKELLRAGTPVVCIFGKSWDLHVRDVLGTTPEENLRIISQSIAYLKSQGREVVFDAEHFFDGFKNNRSYALEVLKAAHGAGADWLCLCDTNGGCFPHEIAAILGEVSPLYPNLGMHCHNDTGMAAANTVEGVRAGARMAQVTLSGFGERCGGASLCTVAPDLQLKLGYECLPPDRLKRLRYTNITFHNIANLFPDHRAPYVGKYAFAHKAGMHIDGIKKNSATFEHIEPASVGATRTFLLSEISGRVGVLERARRFDPTLTKDSPVLGKLVSRLKELEYQGYQFEAARVSFDLEIVKLLGLYHPFYQVEESQVLIDSPSQSGVSQARLTISVDGETITAAAEGNGPVNALDKALREVLQGCYPKVEDLRLRDYRVRVLDSKAGTAAAVRVLIDWADKTDTWTTVGASSDIVTASWKAMTDAVDYLLLKDTNLFIR